jgi:ketosteroid isomerase-like protein
LKMKHLFVAVAAMATILMLVPPQLGSGQGTKPKDSPREAIMLVLGAQERAWNKGDVETFMKGYWNSPELTFAGSSGVTRGWEPVLARYRKTYPNAEAMGHLDFSELEVRPLGNDAALALGRWHLKRTADELGGVFTLVFQRFPEGWRIIHDHTSADKP